MKNILIEAGKALGKWFGIATFVTLYLVVVLLVVRAILPGKGDPDKPPRYTYTGGSSGTNYDHRGLDALISDVDDFITRAERDLLDQ